MILNAGQIAEISIELNTMRLTGTKPRVMLYNNVNLHIFLPADDCDLLDLNSKQEKSMGKKTKKEI